MKSIRLHAALCGAALIAMAGQASAMNVVAIAGTRGERLAAAVDVAEDSVLVRVAHRDPGGTRHPGKHLHIQILGTGSPIDVVRGIPPRSPRARVRQPEDRIFVKVPVPRGAAIHGVPLVSVPGPHAACRR